MILVFPTYSQPQICLYISIYSLIFSEEIDTVEPKPTTMTEKLRKDLLSSYNPYSLPVLHEEHRVAVFMRLTFHHVELVSKKSNIVTTLEEKLYRL
jgi:hypothetical protein